MSSKYCKTYMFAQIPVLARYNYEYLEKQCRDYITDKAPKVEIDITLADIEKEKAASGDDGIYSNGYLESLAFYRKLCEKIALDDIILFHGAAVEVDGKAYLFTAPSGTGKTTHIALWSQILKEKMTIINGDKPLISVSDKIVVYGTPWDGKEKQSKNTSAEIGGICILKRGKENKIRRISAVEALGTLMSQTFRPTGKENMKSVLRNVLTLSSKVPLWILECNISEEAAWTSYNAMCKGE